MSDQSVRESVEAFSSSPWAILGWLARQQWGRLLRGAAWSTAWLVCVMVTPFALSRAIDEGVRTQNVARTVLWASIILVIGVGIAGSSIMRHRTMTVVRMEAAFACLRLLVGHGVRLGAAGRRSSTGEAISVGLADVGQLSETMTIAGPGVGSVIAYLVVAVLLLSISPWIGAVLLLGVPVLVGVIGPLVNRLRARQDVYRDGDGALTAMAADLVHGLRVISGLGGRARMEARFGEAADRLRATGYRVGAVTSWIDALATGVPALFVALVVWLAARLAAAGTITPGELVAVYGYTAILVVPISFFIEGAGGLGRGLVSARRVLAFLAIRPDTVDDGTAAPPAAGAQLADPDSGLRVPWGQLTGVVATRLADALTVLDRLARHTDSAAVLGPVPLKDLPLAVVRRTVLLGDHDGYLFGGRLKDVLDGTIGGAAVGDVLPDPEVALAAAMADEIVRGLPDGLDTMIQPRGRNLSGGQRQRFLLARCLMADPPILLLVEPTSAVDASTEALVIERLSRLRRGRTTLVLTSSSQWLQRADHVVLLDGDRATAAGTHAGLLAGDSRYRSVVLADEDVDADLEQVAGSAEDRR